MSIQDGNYTIFSDIEHFRLAWYQGHTVKVNDSSNVCVQIKRTNGGYHMRYHNKGVNSPWFGASDNLKSEDRVLLSDDKRVTWAIIDAGGGLYRIQIANEEPVWYIREGISNGGSVQLAPSRGSPHELWNIQPAKKDRD